MIYEDLGIWGSGTCDLLEVSGGEWVGVSPRPPPHARLTGPVDRAGQGLQGGEVSFLQLGVVAVPRISQTGFYIFY